MKVVIDDKERGASVEGAVLAVVKRSGIAVPTMPAARQSAASVATWRSEWAS